MLSALPRSPRWPLPRRPRNVFSMPTGTAVSPWHHASSCRRTVRAKPWCMLMDTMTHAHSPNMRRSRAAGGAGPAALGVEKCTRPRQDPASLPRGPAHGSRSRNDVRQSHDIAHEVRIGVVESEEEWVPQACWCMSSRRRSGVERSTARASRAGHEYFGSIAAVTAPYGRGSISAVARRPACRVRESSRLFFPRGAFFNVVSSSLKPPHASRVPVS